MFICVVGREEIEAVYDIRLFGSSNIRQLDHFSFFGLRILSLSTLGGGRVTLLALFFALFFSLVVGPSFEHSLNVVCLLSLSTVTCEERNVIEMGGKWRQN